MRWMWIDRFIEFESGHRARAIKNVSIVEEQMDDYIPGYPVMPHSLIVEGMAQTAGLLVAEHGGFQNRVVLAKVGKAVFHLPARPGDQLVYTATVETFQPDGALCTGKSHVDGQLQAEIDLVFAHLDERFRGVDLFLPEELLQMLRIFRLYEVGRYKDGERLRIPPHMLAAEVHMAED
ncbi:MAG: 3-hydroxyacyl-ACP dehydratase FabZ family protein [Pirellulaceae bacterium]